MGSTSIGQQDTPVSRQSAPVFRTDEHLAHVISPISSLPRSDPGFSHTIRGEIWFESPRVVVEGGDHDRVQVEAELQPTTGTVDTPIYAPTPIHAGSYVDLSPTSRAPHGSGPQDQAISQEDRFSDEHPEVTQTSRGIVPLLPYPSIPNHSDYVSHYHPRQGPSSLFYASSCDVNHGQPDHFLRISVRHVEHGPVNAYAHSTTRPSGLTHMIFKCSLCGDHGAATLVTPLVLCSGCGPAGNIRYCSIACLLADAYHHSLQCSNLPPSLKLVYHDLTPHFIYEKDPIMPLDSSIETPEKFRQKAFSMYCRSGPFPAILKAWAKRNPGEMSLDGLDILEMQKRTGDYHVFRSSATASGVRYNPGADVIFTVLLRRGDPLKDIFRRSLNASFLVYHPIILDFLFRTIRHFIIDANEFEIFPHLAQSTVVFEEFKQQYSSEFAFDTRRYDHDWEVFSTEKEWPRVVPFLIELENKHPILQYWMRH
ncbi:hypothetical protein BJ875DRAFT_463008 [Amylocarpus encephaloides]|uniref:Uncharacterized protein n=1 Tax=Amylocarpus encephaloides TaxID=45428 RepID=A0A9P7YHC3_9HELO|nr:hypothetical protein BJ875DRAFT_463008 [Amylocarpus encephaloides]